MDKKRISVNAILQMLYRVLVMVVPLATSPYISYHMGADPLGTYTFSYTIAIFFVELANLGITLYGNRKIAKVRDDQDLKNKVFTELMIAHAITSVITIGLYYGLVAGIGTFTKGNDISTYQQFLYIQGLIVIGAAFDISWFYFGIEKVKVTVGFNSLVKILSAAAIFIFIHTPDDLWIYTLIMALNTLVGALSMWIPLKRYVRFVKVEMKWVWKHFKPLSIFFLTSLSNIIFTYVDKLMLGAMTDGNVSLGLYENAYKIIEFPTSLITTIGYVMLPVMANYHATKKSGEAKIIRMIMFISMYLAIPMTLGLAAISYSFPVNFWGYEFMDCTIIIGMLCPLLFFRSFNGVIRQEYLIPYQHDKTHSIAIVVAATVNIVLNYFLIQYFGAQFDNPALGACISTIISCFIIFFIQNATCVKYKDVKISEYFKDMIVPLIVGGAMFIVVWSLDRWVFPRFAPLASTLNKWLLVVEILIALAIYFPITIIIYKHWPNPNTENIFKFLKEHRNRKKAIATTTSEASPEPIEEEKNESSN